MNETLTRALSGLLYILVLVSSTLFFESFIVLFGLLLVLTAIEFCELVKLSKVVPVTTSLGLYCLSICFNSTETLEYLILPIIFIVAVKALLFLFGEQVQLNLFQKYLFVLGYVSIPFALLVKLALISGEFNPRIIIGLFILIWLNDTMAYVVGKSIGKTKLFEKVSPKKTVEGFLGGLVFSIGFSIVVSRYYVHESVVHWIIIAAIVVVFGSLGDLIESKFKRVAGVKDSGKIMPGHGGMFDRLDSIIFAAPFVFLFYQIINYVS